MKKYLLIFITSLCVSLLPAGAQNYSVNQNQQNVNINLPVIEKPVYIERYRTVYVDRPQPKRIAKKLDSPIQLLGYLWVYPEDLGNFKQPPYQIIENLNKLNSYGHNNWRIPTPDELAVLEANADRVGLGEDIYLATDHSNGVLRLVARPETPEEVAERYDGILVGNIIWAKKDSGASRAGEEGKEYFGDSEDRAIACPKPWRIPTLAEFNALFGSESFSKVNLTYGKYWTSTKHWKSPYTGYDGKTHYWWYFISTKYKGEDWANESNLLLVRCVRDVE